MRASSARESAGDAPLTPARASEGPARRNPAVVFQADGGHRAGFGHLGRCMAAAQELGDEAAFQVGDAAATAWLAARGARTVPDPIGAHVVVLDRVAPVPAAEVRAIQGAGSRVCLIDDSGDGRALADLVVDPPTGPRWPPAAGRRLAGFDHVLLRREMRAAVAEPMRAVGVVLALGGSDPNNATPLLADAMIRRGIPILSVLGPGYSGPPSPGRTVSDPVDFARALAGADLVVCGFGHMLLEAAHLGVPAVVLAQRAADPGDAAAFATHGTMLWLDATEGLDLEAITAAVVDLHGNARLRSAMGARGRQLIDGRGAARVASAIRRLP